MAGFINEASHERAGVKRRDAFALVALPLLVVASGALVYLFRHEIWNLFSTPERIQTAVESWGVLAPVGFMLVQFVQVVVFIIPGEIPQIAGGYLFGLPAGILYSTVGILVGSGFNFFLARILGVPFVRRLFREKQIESFQTIVHSPRAQIGFFLLFVIPGIPKDILCYVAGISPLRFSAFILISTIGRMPGIIGSAAMGSAAASREWVLAIIIMVVAIVLFFIGLLFRERVHAFVERYALKQETPATRQSPVPETPSSDAGA